jgi:hypothetical protein
MTTFNISFVENWKTKGFSYILVVPRDKYGVLRPLTHEKQVLKGYTIQIDELKFINLKEEYFLVKQKDAFHLNGGHSSGNLLARSA